jgi:hypothetical protein
MMLIHANQCFQAQETSLQGLISYSPVIIIKSTKEYNINVKNLGINHEAVVKCSPLNPVNKRQLSGGQK